NPEAYVAQYIAGLRREVVPSFDLLLWLRFFQRAPGFAIGRETARVPVGQGDVAFHGFQSSRLLRRSFARSFIDSSCKWFFNSCTTGGNGPLKYSSLVNQLVTACASKWNSSAST